MNKLVDKAKNRSQFHCRSRKAGGAIRRPFRIKIVWFPGFWTGALSSSP
ncbi:hypothetical protein [Mesorhizobium sp. M0040]